MANVLVDRSTLESLGAAIRAKNGSDKKYLPSQMAEAISALNIGDGHLIDQLITRTVKNYSNDEITEIPDYFLASNPIEEINIPSVTSIGKYAFSFSSLPKIESNAVTTLGEYAFANSDIQTVSLPNVQILPRYCFYQCAQLISVYFPAATTLMAYCFELSSIKNVKFENVQSLNGNSFHKSKLEKIDLPNAINLAGADFYECADIKSVILRSSSVCTMGRSTVFGKSSIENGDGYVYVPKSLINSYKSATNWILIASKLRAIEDYPNICA